MDVVESNFAQLDGTSGKGEGTSEGVNLRFDMVDAARRFMLSPKVRDTPFEQQKEFLVRKGLSEEEVAEAKKLAEENKVCHRDCFFGSGYA